MTQSMLLTKLIELTRYVPFVLAISCVIMSVFEPFSIHLHILEWLSGINILTIYTLYILSYLLKFCWKHRLAIHFLSTYWLVSFIDSIYLFPITDFQYSMVIIVIAILFLLYYIIKDNLIYITEKIFKYKIPWMQ